MEKIQTFHQDINEFPVKNSEDEQNERLRKIHTFQASFDDFVDYINQRIADTKMQENMNVLNFENFILNEGVNEIKLVTESLQSSFVRDLMSCLDTSSYNNWKSFASMFYGIRSAGAKPLAWDKIQDTDFDVYTISGKYPDYLHYGEKFNTRNIDDADKAFVSGVKKARKNNLFAIYYKENELFAASLGEYFYTFMQSTETDRSNPEYKAAADAWHNSAPDDPKRDELFNAYMTADKKFKKVIHTWNSVGEVSNMYIWSQLLVDWGVNKVCVLRNTESFVVNNLRKERAQRKSGIIDMSPEGLAAYAKANVERYKKIIAQKHANSDSAFAKQDEEFMSTIMEAMKALTNVRQSRNTILTKSSEINEAAEYLDNMMSLYENYIRYSNDYVKLLQRAQSRGKEIDEERYSERSEMEKCIERFKYYKSKMDAIIELINNPD